VADYLQGVPIRINDTFYLSGTATDPTQVVYSILGPDGTLTAYTWPGAPEITHVGTGQFQLNLSPPALPGPYQYDVDATGTVVASRAGSFTVLANVATGPDVPWPVVGPCQPWVSSQDVWRCCGQPTEVIDGVECNVDFTAEAMAASQILFELSGRLYAGACEKTARPCRNDCGCGFGIQILSRGHIVGPWDWGYGGWYWMGNSWGCEGNPCGCNPLSRVLLSGYPVREVVEVKIDGDVVDPDTYRLDNWRWLTRVRPTADDEPLMWPSCQLTDLPDTEHGTFSVTYRYGQDPPLEGLNAAAALACQLHKSCNGGSDDCEIPANAVRVTRQGVTIDKNAMDWFFGRRGAGEGGGWMTGIIQVDTFLNSFNKSGMQQRPKTWSPDGYRYAKVYGT
jgi:hypothetical protein